MFLEQNKTWRNGMLDSATITLALNLLSLPIIFIGYIQLSVRHTLRTHGKEANTDDEHLCVGLPNPQRLSLLGGLLGIQNLHGAAKTANVSSSIAVRIVMHIT
jgi:hypothetical protein